MNYAIVDGVALQSVLVAGTTQLAFGSNQGSSGVAVDIGTFSFTVDDLGQYLAEVTIFPKAVYVAQSCILQMRNVTLGTIVGQAPILADIGEGGVKSNTVQIPFTVVDVAHAFRLEVVVPVGVQAPNAVVLTIQNAIQFRMFVRSLLDLEGTFGSGADGVVTIAAPTTLLRDMYYSSLTVNDVLTTAGFRVFVRGTCTIGPVGAIRNDGGAGATVGTAGTAAPTGTLGGSGAGGAGGVAAGAAGGSTATSLGGSGGAGGLGSGGAGGAAGVATVPTAAQGGVLVVQALPHAVTTQLAGVSAALVVLPGAGGGGGGGDATSGAGGGGGGGVIMVAAQNFVGSGAAAIQARGGAGGSAVAGARGGGGGGGGGTIVTVSANAFPATIARAVTGGAFGAGFGAGAPGVVGVAGIASHLIAS